MTRPPSLAAKARLKVNRKTGGLLLLYPERGLALNSTAAEIVRLCDGARSVADIVSALLEAHPGANRERVTREVSAFLEELASRRLLETGG